MPGMLRNKILGWLVLALVVYYIATDPTGAGHTGKAVLQGAQSVAHGLIAFLKALSN
jgi:hypothetical protein